MSRAQELAQRRLALQARIAAQRILLGQALEPLLGGARRTDQRLATASRLVLRPAALAGAILFVLVLGRTRSLALLGTGVAVVGSALRLRRLVAGLLASAAGSALRR